MITVRNTDAARSLTVRADEPLEVGMFVKLVQGSASGAPPKVRKALKADLADAATMVGMVDFIQDNSEAVDYNFNEVGTALTLNTGADGTMAIPLNAQCNVWWNQPEIGFDIYSTAFADLSTIREPTAVTIDDATSKVALMTAVDPAVDPTLGFVYRNEGPEITLILTGI